MKTRTMLAVLMTGLFAAAVSAQDRTPAGQAQPPAGEAGRGHGPPPQAYEDCKGRKAGDAVQHTTPEGKVAATCVESPKGLVARPNQPRPAPQGGTAR